MVREVARSPHLQEQVDEIAEAFLDDPAGDRARPGRGRLPAPSSTRVSRAGSSTAALEEILTGWVLGQLPDGDEEVARAERTIVDVVCGGLSVRGVAGA